MPQHVWVHINGDPLTRSPYLEPLTDGAPAYVFTMSRYEKPAFSRLAQIFPMPDPFAQGMYRLAPDGNNARLAAFARDAHHALRKVQILRLDACEFRQPQARGVTKLE